MPGYFLEGSDAIVKTLLATDFKLASVGKASSYGNAGAIIARRKRFWNWIFGIYCKRSEWENPIVGLENPEDDGIVQGVESISDRVGNLARQDRF